MHTTCMSRPKNISIIGAQVTAERKCRKLTQVELAALVYNAAGKYVPERDTLERRCRDWERGRISGAFLKALLKVLQLDAEILQGGKVPGPAPDRIAQITKQLKEQLAAGNVHTQQFIDHHRPTPRLDIADLVEAEPELIEEAARSLDVWLGAAQLTTRVEQLDELQAITGWSLSQVLHPGAAHGHWLVVSEGALGGVCELIQGIAATRSLVIQEVERWAKGRTCDSRASLKDESPWFRIHMEDPWYSQLSTTISFVRCEPTSTGLTYCSPGELERLYMGLDPAWMPLADTLERHFNYVRNFGDIAPWPLFKDMRLALSDTSDRSQDAPPPIVARFTGDIEGFRSKAPTHMAGTEHSVAVTCLAANLQDDLRPYLDHWPRECWKAVTHGGSIVIEINTGYHIPRQLGRKAVETRHFELALIHEMPDGRTAVLPCVGVSLQNLLERVNWAIADLPSAPVPDQLFVGPMNPV